MRRSLSGQSFEQLPAVQDRCLFNSTRPLKPSRDRKGAVRHEPGPNSNGL